MAEEVDVAVPEVARELDIGLDGSPFSTLDPDRRQFELQWSS